MLDGRPIIVLIESVFRGSRLHILANVIVALKESYRVIVLTRCDYDCEHYRELLLPMSAEFELIPIEVDLQGEWTRPLTIKEFLTYLYHVRELEKRIGKNYKLVFMAVDDYAHAFLAMFAFARLMVRAESIYVVKYRVQIFLRHEQRHPKERLQHFVMTVALRTLGARLIAFDERLANVLVGRKRVIVLPDPWFGDFSPKRRQKARKRQGFRADQFVMMTVGRQDGRKGFPFILSALKSLFGRVNRATLVVVGRIAERYVRAGEALVEEYGKERARHINKFVPDRELPDFFASADVIVLPYAANFSSSSGVLARAAASGVPVIASAHGLVGYRVKTWGLGETFRYGSVEEFVEAAKRVSEYSEQRLASVRDSCTEFAAACSIDAFHTAIVKGLAEDATDGEPELLQRQA